MDSSGHLLLWIVIAALNIVPFWKAMTKAGMNPAWSALVVIPFLGFIAALFVFAYGDWTNVDREHV